MKTLASKRTRPLVLLVAALAMSSVLPMIAHAGEPSARLEPSAADKETARTLVGLGHDKTKQSDFAGALDAYNQAHAIMGVPTTGILLALAQTKVEQLLEAHDTCVQVALMPAQRNEPAAFAKARAKAKSLAAELALRIPSLLATLEAADGGQLEDAKVVIDGVELTGLSATLPRKVNPGAHVVAATAKRYRAEPMTLNVAEKDTQPVRLVLQPLPPEPLPPEPPPALIAPPPALIVPPPALIAPPPALIAPPPALIAPPPRVPESPNAAIKPWLVWGSFGVGAVGFVTWVVTGGLSLSAASRARDLCPSLLNCSEAARPDYDRAITLANASNVALVFGGLGAVAGTVSAFVVPGPMFPGFTKAQASIAPYLGPTGMGLVGTF